MKEMHWSLKIIEVERKKMITKLFSGKEPMRLAIFMSGTGSNAKRIIEKYLGQRHEGIITFEPALIFTDNPESNAHKIAKIDYKDNGFEIPLVVNPIKEFYEKQGCDNIRDFEVREKYDRTQLKLLEDHRIDAIALAGYDWVITSVICDNILTTNVHPGNLRKTFPGQKKRMYTGLGWVPSAKAILNSEDKVYTSVHLVTSQLDGGPSLAVSAPQPIQEEVLSLEDRTVLLGEAQEQEKPLTYISKFIRKHLDMEDEEISKLFPIYGFAKDCQERLKVHGDWVIFPQVIEYISLGFYGKGETGNLYFNNKPIPNGLF